MTQSKPLIPIQVPLQGTTLIEASAGTGKTFTMASLYLRLLLQLGQSHFSKPLSVDEILVVTFTEASTQELKSRIRERILLAKKQFIAYRDKSDIAIFMGSDNEFLVKATPEDKPSDQFLRLLDLDLAIQQLQFAEQNMDLAAIYTIHGFCRRMLMQYAVNSGIHFNLDLVQDETPLLLELTKQFWREQFYPQPLSVAQFISDNLGSPQQLLNYIQRYLTGETLKPTLNEPRLLEKSLAEFLRDLPNEQQNNQNELEVLMSEIQSQWTKNVDDFCASILADLEKNAKDKLLNAKKLHASHLSNRCAKVEEWILGDELTSPPDALWQFTRSYMLYASKDGENTVEHAFFSWLETKQKEVEYTRNKSQILQDALIYHCIKSLNERLNQYKQNHSEKGFNDLLRLLNQALKSERGDELAELIRHQYPFAMIDEFQDTDETQYQIFSRLYVDQPDCGFMMIGDPKQAIYQFRGADIFTYLKAADDAGDQRFTLGKNYRSSAELIDAVNGLLQFDNAFLYEKIAFESVKSGKNQPHFVLNGEIQAPLHFYVNEFIASENSKKNNPVNKVSADDMAECCADSILNWLQSAEKNQAFFEDEKGKKDSVKNDDIAVLVRTGAQAKLVQDALRRRGIASVYLSDRNNVFYTKEARELVFILQACLEPYKERHILNAIATGIFALTAADIQQVRQQETLLERWVNRFESYRQVWQRQGVLPMLYQLLLDKNDDETITIPEKMLKLPKGERRLTDILHLAELLQQNAALNESEAALLRWFERQVQGADDNQSETENSRQVRLESEQKLVKIVTIHKSKGLEYSLVWLPFLGLPPPNFPSAVKLYHNAEGQPFWDMQGEHQEQVDTESLAEDMRLLYVALTRAKYQLCIAVPTEFSGRWNALYYALSQGKIGTTKAVEGSYAKQLVDELSERLGENAVAQSALKFNEIPKKLKVATPKELLNAAEFSADRHIEKNWGISSFTALSEMHQQQRYRQQERENSALLNADGHDYDLSDDRDLSNETESYDGTSLWANFPAEHTPLDLPRGTKLGLEIHRFFEKNAFNQPLNEESIKLICQRLQLDEHWNAPMKQWITGILQQPILPNEQFCLAQLKPQDSLKEMQFYLKFDRAFDVEKFNQALRNFHPYFSEPYLFKQIEGMLQGFMDLVFRHNGKYYLVDYKTNFLGTNAESYADKALLSAMQHHYYDLQYLIYCVALHRYFSVRDPDYSYETHFGGVIYGFVRGMTGAVNFGVFFDRPSEQLILALEKLFYA